MAASTLSETVAHTRRRPGAGERLLHALRQPLLGVLAPAPSSVVDSALTLSFARGYLKSAPIGLIITAGLFLAAMLWLPVSALAPAFLVIVAGTLATGVACRRAIAFAPEAPLASSWRHAFVVGEAVHGCGWVLFATPFILDPSVSADVDARGFVVAAALVGMVATAILRAPIFAAVVAGFAPWTAALIAASLTSEIGLLAPLTLGIQILLGSFAWRLHRATAAMIRSRAEIESSFAELERARASTSEANRRAQEADRAKQLFLSTMSHELRTPLNAILGFSEVMKNEVLGSHSTPSYREYSSDIHGSGQHLLSLINEILDLTRIQAGHYELQEEPLRLEALVADVLAATAPSIRAKGLQVATVIDPTLAPIQADARAVRQILGNLVSNAIKFTGAGGHVTVKGGWTSLGGEYVSVVDDGPGIPAEEIPAVLSSFGRGSLAVNTAAQGVGLGLPIVKGLAELHSGRFILRSRPGEGTAATVVFPAERIAEDETTARQLESNAA